MIDRLRTIACAAIPGDAWARLAFLNMGADVAMVLAIWWSVARAVTQPVASVCQPAAGLLVGSAF